MTGLWQDYAQLWRLLFEVASGFVEKWLPIQPSAPPFRLWLECPRAPFLWSGYEAIEP